MRKINGIVYCLVKFLLRDKIGFELPKKVLIILFGILILSQGLLIFTATVLNAGSLGISIVGLSAVLTVFVMGFPLGVAELESRVQLLHIKYNNNPLKLVYELDKLGMTKYYEYIIKKDKNLYEMFE